VNPTAASAPSLIVLDLLLYWAATLLYAGVSALSVLQLYFPGRRLAAWGGRVLTAALAVNSAGLLVHWHRAGHAPYITQFEVAASTVWVVAVAFLLARRRFPGLAGTAAFLFPVATLALGLIGTTATPDVQTPPLSFATVWLGIHVLFTQLFVACALFAAGLAFLGLTGLSERPGARVLQVPVGRMADDLIYRLTAAGFFFLTIMILAGSIWANQAWGRFWGWDSIEVWSLICWLAYALQLHLMRTLGWQGRPLAWLSLATLAVALFSMFGVVLVFPSIHGSYMVR
jgi:ABC-type transport system involved in cytochrome c biogenesis permease subunit